MATELGKAYVQILPSAKGIKGNLEKEINPGVESLGENAGSLFGKNLLKKIAALGIGTAIVKTISSGLKEGAALEQSIGGVETLFKSSADKVIKNAKNAYKTAGVSANTYMENVTSFSASLLQSMGGDTEKAADIAHMAMVDMSDNANKMGTDMQDIQNAYQGFAKQNYTMLDNLKLGYGGTKTEMERLLKDATKLTGVKYDINNLSDVYSAVHTIQKELGITGTTAIEADETFSGSFTSMKASVSNLLGALALGDGVGEAMIGLVETVSTFLFNNFLPMLGQFFMSLPDAIGTFISVGFPILTQKISEFVDQIITFLTTKGPSFFNKGLEFVTKIVTGIIENLPSVIKGFGELVNKALVFLLEKGPDFLTKGIEFISNIAKGIWDNLPEIIKSIKDVIKKVIDTLVEKGPEFIKKGIAIVADLAKGIWNNLPKILSTIGTVLARVIIAIGEKASEFLGKGVKLIGELALGLIKAIPGLVAKIPQIITAMVDELGKAATKFFNIGKNLIQGLWNGIKSVKDWIMDKISGFASSIVNGIKSFFGINSPSRVFAEIGMYLDKGLAKGIVDNTDVVSKAMNELEDSATGTFNSDFEYNLSANTSRLNANIQSGNVSLSNLNKTPIILQLGSNTYKAFIEDIEDGLSRKAQLELLY